MSGFYEKMFDEYERHYRLSKANILNWYISDEEEITVELADGTKERFDYVDRTVRVIFSDGVDLVAKSISTEEGWKREFRYNLIRIMAIKGINQFKLADLAELTQGSVSNYVNGISVPSIYICAKIARALDCTISDLVKFDELII